jgi:hypothetical protein
MEDRALATMSVADTMSIGQVLAKSGFFSDIKEQAQAVAKILAGQELGIGPVAALRGINFVKNKMNLDAGLVAALIQRSGRYDYRVLTHTADECKLAFFDGGKQVGESRFAMADAKAAGLVAGDNWQKYPRNMLFARALTNGARWYCPGVYFGAVYSGDELADTPEPPAITVLPPEPSKPVNPIDAAPEIPYSSSPAAQEKIDAKVAVTSPHPPNGNPRNRRMAELVRLGTEWYGEGGLVFAMKNHVKKVYNHDSAAELTNAQIEEQITEFGRRLDARKAELAMQPALAPFSEPEDIERGEQP